MVVSAGVMVVPGVLSLAKAYGYELIIDLHDCAAKNFTPDGLGRYSVELCKLIDMNREGFHIWASDPADYETDPPHLHGTSAVQFITTSSLVIHTLPKLRVAYVNIFSCKTFDPDSALTFTAAFFSGVVKAHHWIERQ